MLVSFQSLILASFFSLTVGAALSILTALKIEKIKPRRKVYKKPAQKGATGLSSDISP